MPRTFKLVHRTAVEPALLEPGARLLTPGAVTTEAACPRARAPQ